MAHVNAASFEIGGRKFYRYLARDSHGSNCQTYMVDGNSVSRKDFQDMLAKALRNSSMWDCVYSVAMDHYFGSK